MEHLVCDALVGFDDCDVTPAEDLLDERLDLARLETALAGAQFRDHELLDLARVHGLLNGLEALLDQLGVCDFLALRHGRQ